MRRNASTKPFELAPQFGAEGCFVAYAAHELRGELHHEAEPAWTMVDGLLLERLVANLIENAVRHNVPGGWVEIATHTGAGHATFTIANTGPAIGAGELARLFEPFQRHSSHERRSADGNAAGVGLGLAIVRAIATAHHAVVNAQPRTGGGLRIQIGFPAPDGGKRWRHARSDR
jgi:signal transduction histidine kinase